jgi:hypothetical protein
MNRFGFFASLVLLSAFLANCTGKAPEPAPSDAWEAGTEAVEEDSSFDVGLVEEQSVKVKASPPQSGKNSSSKGAGTYDNMRGFDPASEDDMDDNGMSRYMENDDEEGWD